MGFSPWNWLGVVCPLCQEPIKNLATGGGICDICYGELQVRLLARGSGKFRHFSLWNYNHEVVKRLISIAKKTIGIWNKA